MSYAIAPLFGTESCCNRTFAIPFEKYNIQLCKDRRASSMARFFGLDEHWSAGFICPYCKERRASTDARILANEAHVLWTSTSLNVHRIR